MVQFPQEIVDLIVDEMATSSANDLTSVHIISRPFCLSARRRLFRDLRIRLSHLNGPSQSDVQLLQLALNSGTSLGSLPSLLTYVKRLFITFPNSPAPDEREQDSRTLLDDRVFLGILEQLQSEARLVSLSVECLYSQGTGSEKTWSWQNFPLHFESTIRSLVNIKTLKALRLAYIGHVPVSAFKDVSPVRFLTLSNSFFSARLLEDDHAFKNVQGIQFDIFCFSDRSVTDPLGVGPFFLQTRGDLMERCSASLKRLSLSINCVGECPCGKGSADLSFRDAVAITRRSASLFQALDFSRFPHLETLRMTMGRVSFKEGYIRNLLDLLQDPSPAPSLRTFEVRANVSERDFYRYFEAHLFDEEWTELDNRISDMGRFPKLESVVIDFGIRNGVHRNLQEARRLAVMENGFPRVAERLGDGLVVYVDDTG